MLLSSAFDVPRPLIDPITSLVEALSVVALAVQRPRRNSVIILAVDTHRRGLHMFRSSPLSTLTAHHIVRECSYVPTVNGVIIVSHTTSAPRTTSDESLLVQTQSTLSAAGIHLIDWVVVGAGGMYCPRTLCGQPDPWPYGSTCV